MKINTVCVWKDATDRQDLSEEQLSTLAHPAGKLELSETELESVFGGFGEYGVGFSRADAVDQHAHSYALICDINLFSLNVGVLNILNIGNPISQGCVSND